MTPPNDLPEDVVKLAEAGMKLREDFEWLRPDKRFVGPLDAYDKAIESKLNPSPDSGK